MMRLLMKIFPQCFHSGYTPHGKKPSLSLDDRGPGGLNRPLTTRDCGVSPGTPPANCGLGVFFAGSYCGWAVASCGGQADCAQKPNVFGVSTDDKISDFGRDMTGRGALEAGGFEFVSSSSHNGLAGANERTRAQPRFIDEHAHTHRRDTCQRSSRTGGKPRPTRSKQQNQFSLVQSSPVRRDGGGCRGSRNAW